MLTTDTTTAVRARVRHAAALLSVRWGTRVLRTVTASDTPIRPADLADGPAAIPAGSIHAVVTTLTDTGLLTKTPVADRRGYTLAPTPASRALPPVHEAALAWAKSHHRAAGTEFDPADAIEDALGLLAVPGTAPLLGELALRESLSYPELTDRFPEALPGQLRYRLDALADRGLVTRTGAPRNYRWELAPAGLDLGPVFNQVSLWGRDHLSTLAGITAGQGPAVLGVHVTAPTGTEESRARAAALRSSTLRLTFSHLPAPQPAPLLRPAPSINGARR